MTLNTDIIYTPAAGVYDPARAHEIQAFIPAPDRHSALPGDVTKAGAIAMIAKGLRLCGLGEGTIAQWRCIADTTERAAWHAHDRSPVNWRRQCDMARELGLSERQWRRGEVALERAGVLARATAENGYRGRRSGEPWRGPVSCGLSLEPALANYPAFVERLAAADVAEAARLELVMNTRLSRRRLRQTIAAIPDREVHHWAGSALADLEGDLRPASPRVAEADVLLRWHRGLLDLEARLRRALAPMPLPDPDAQDAPPTDTATPPGEEHAMRHRTAPLPSKQDPTARPVQETAEKNPSRNQPPVENVEKQLHMSAAPDIGGRCHIQPQINLNESCKRYG